ncbi:MAG: domain S-box/diguanylate cyclase protein [Gammaproteobacteria bacterium]|nr:domain S-box/diguanylate cyclase protein [Gammaproteobacteria bacterium]
MGTASSASAPPPNCPLLELQLQLQQLIASAARTAVLSVSVDRINAINLAIGHRMGEQVLRQVAALLASESGELGTIARTAEDRYVVILPGADATDAAARAAEIVDTLSRPFEFGEYQLRLSASVGIAVSSEDAQDAASLLADADAALHDAKTRGGERYQFYTVQMKQTALKRLTLESELRRAIERSGERGGELELHYQPKVCIRTGEISAAEALVRWRSERWGLLCPDAFIPIAEQSGLIMQLGEWAVETACRHASAFRCEGQGASVAVCVNMSPAQLRAPRPVDILRAALRRHRLPPRLLEIELTESAVMADVHSATASLLEIAELGVGLALDDFGTGYSNLSQLGRLPIRTLKIDRSLVTGIAISSRDAVIVRTLIEMGHALGMIVVAEGVETEAQLSVLRENRCDEAQGYLIAKPMEVTAFAAWLRHWNTSTVTRRGVANS